MSKLLSQLTLDIQSALRARQAERLSCLRMVLSKIKEKQVAPGVESELDEAQIQKVIGTYAKQCKDSATAYAEAGREADRDKELREIEMLQDYLPKQLEEGQLRSIVEEAIKSAGATSMKDMGQVMGLVMKKVAGRAEGGRVQQCVRQLLSKQSTEG